MGNFVTFFQLPVEFFVDLRYNKRKEQLGERARAVMAPA